jgi:hypothetical protein
MAASSQICCGCVRQSLAHNVVSLLCNSTSAIGGIADSRKANAISHFRLLRDPKTRQCIIKVAALYETNANPVREAPNDLAFALELICLNEKREFVRDADNALDLH